MESRDVTTSFESLDEGDVIAASERRSEPAWLRDRRLEALKVFSDRDWPTVRDEEWKYTNPKRFDWSRPLLADPGDAPARTGGALADLRDGAAGAARIVDGGVVEVTVTDAAADRGVVVADLGVAVDEHADVVRTHLGTAVGANDKLSALNLAAFSGGVLVSVPGDVELDEPVVIDVQAATDGAAIVRILVVTGAHAKASVLIDRSGDAEATVSEVVEVIAGTGSHVQLLSVQDWGSRVDHVADHTALVGDNAEVTHTELTVGGRTVYVRPDVHLSSPGGSADLRGAYLTDTGQQFEHRALLHHDAPKTTSDMLYKGVLQGRSRASWFGNVRIEPHAPGCASDETNRNLILSDGAQADTVPFLEISNSDVARCGHASSVGQLDPLQLFYLESRGISREEAVRLLILGYFAEVTDDIELDGVAEWLSSTVAERIRSSELTALARAAKG